MLKAATPVLHVSRSTEAEAFYGRLGFMRQFRYRPDDARADPCYFGMTRDDVRLHLSSFAGDGVSGQCVYITVDDVDALHREFTAAGFAIDSGPVDQIWGNREMYLKDPDGNSLRFIQERKGT